MSFTPVDEHYKFYKALKEGKFLLRTDRLNGEQEVIDLTHPRIKGVASNIYNFEYKDLQIIEMTDQQPLSATSTALEEAGIKGFNEAIKLCAKELRKQFLPVTAERLLKLRKSLPGTVRKPTEILKDKTKVSQEEVKGFTEFVEQAVTKESTVKTDSADEQDLVIKPDDVWSHPEETNSKEEPLTTADTKVEAVTAYKTSDGRLFDTEQDALAHQTATDFTDWYLEKGRFYYDGHSVGSGLIKGWLEKHAEDLKVFIDDWTPLSRSIGAPPAGAAK